MTYKLSVYCNFRFVIFVYEFIIDSRCTFIRNFKMGKQPVKAALLFFRSEI